MSFENYYPLNSNSNDLVDRSRTLASCEQKESESLLIMLASGNDDSGKRATLALSAACSALAMENEVSIFLVGDGAFWADSKNTIGVVVAGFPPLESLIETYLELGGRITICSTCAGIGSFCGIDEHKKLAVLTLREGIEVQGFASVISEAQKGATLTF